MNDTLENMIEVKYSKEIPAIYYKCRQKFGVVWHQGIIITYGDTVYCKVDISPDLKVHEETHIRQQAVMGKDLWWEKYLSDKKFRLSQEVEAYRNQMVYIKKNYSNVEIKSLKKGIVQDMCTLYDGMCTIKQARKLLRG